MEFIFFFKKIRELIEKNIPEEEASKLVMLYALKSVSKDSNRELTSLIQLLKSKKVAEHWIEVTIYMLKGLVDFTGFHRKNNIKIKTFYYFLACT